MRSATFLALIMLAGPAQAHGFTSGDITIGHPYSYAVASSAPSALGYLTITNDGIEPDRLTGIEAPGSFDAIMLHSTEIDANGVARMLHRTDLAIAPGETVTFGPQGLHVMFTGLGGDAWEEGEKIPATLIFENAGRIDVEFDVEARGARDPKGAHTGMDHSNPERAGGTTEPMDHGTTGN